MGSLFQTDLICRGTLRYLLRYRVFFIFMRRNNDREQVSDKPVKRRLKEDNGIFYVCMQGGSVLFVFSRSNNKGRATYVLGTTLLRVLYLIHNCRVGLHICMYIQHNTYSIILVEQYLIERDLSIGM